jgi:hypothetical protein
MSEEEVKTQTKKLEEVNPEFWKMLHRQGDAKNSITTYGYGLGSLPNNGALVLTVVVTDGFTSCAQQFVPNVRVKEIVDTRTSKVIGHELNSGNH